MEEVMVCLVGEQPLPNLLLVRYDQPKHVVLAYTESTRQVSNRLERVLRAKKALIYPLEVPPFNIPTIRQELEKFITGRGWKPPQVVFNLTGGTKAMAFAAYSLVEKWHGRFIYLESAETISRFYRYHFDRDGMACLDDEGLVPAVISLDDYLSVHLGPYGHKDFPSNEGGKFEKAVYEALEPVVDEIDHGVQAGGALDIDLAFRCGNQVGIAEVKHGTLSKRGIDQLNTAGRREFLGIYTEKFLIAGTIPPPDKPLSDLKELAEVSEIKVIELPSYGQTGNLSNQDRERLVRKVAETLGCW